MPLPKQSELVAMLKSANPDLEQKKPNDIIPKNQPEPSLDKDKLSEYLMRVTKNDINDRETYGFSERMAYNEKAYNGIKDEFMQNWPHPRASAYPVPMSPVLEDVGASQIQNAMFRNPEKTVTVRGWGKEDKPYAPLVAHIHNWQNSVGVDVYDVQGQNIRRTLRHGTGFVKTWMDIGEEYKIKHASIPLNLILKPVKEDGCQRHQTSHITHLIPLNENDWNFRRGLKIGSKPVYDHLDLIAPGFSQSETLTQEELKMLENQVSGLSISEAEVRDYRYMAETQVTYYPPDSTRAKELIVWWSLRHGVIHRVINNEDLIRNWSSYKCYPIDGVAFHMSLHWKIRNIQEKANYTDKQVTDASDIAMMSPGFIEEGSGFDPQTQVMVLTGLYEVKRGTKIDYPQRNIAPIIQRAAELDRLWHDAQRLSMFNEYQEGTTPDRDLKVGVERLRAKKSEDRFQTMLNTFGIGWKGTNEIQYFLNNKHMPRKMAVKILGSADYSNMGQIFPKDGKSEFGLQLQAKFNFSPAGRSQNEVDLEQENHLAFTDKILEIYKGMAGPTWHALKEQADIIGYQNFERMVPRPPEADIMSVEEILERIESGEREIIPSPMIDVDAYLFKLNAFKRMSERYENYSQEQKVVLQKLIGFLESIRFGKKMAELEHNAKSDPDMAMALDDVMKEVSQNGGIPGQGGGMPEGGLKVA